MTIITAICPSGLSAPDNGNLIAYDEYLGAPGANSYTHFSQPSTNGAAISYDGVNRLTGVDDSGGWSRSFAYDQWGNMSIVPAGSSGAIGSNAPQAADASTLYNAHNQRTDTGQGYDATGNVNAMTNFSNISYDAENRLLTASSPSPFSYEYDGNGRRVTKTGNNNTTVYVYDAAGELAAEYNTASQPAPACTTCYLSHDYLGSVRMMTDASGTVISRHDLLPFGEEIPGGQAGRSMAMGFAGSTDGLSQKFTGKERDAESGPDYFGARYYGSALGRFTSPDPENLGARSQDPQRWNMYSYGVNNPLRYSDPTGTDPDDEPLSKDQLVHRAQQAWDSIKQNVDYALNALFSGTQTVDGMLSPPVAGQSAWIDPHNAVSSAIRESGRGLDVLAAVLSVLTPLPGDGAAIKAGTVLTKTIETSQGRLVFQFVVTEVSKDSIKGIPSFVPEGGMLATTSPGPAAIKAVLDAVKAELKQAGVKEVEAKWLQMSPTAVKSMTITLR